MEFVFESLIQERARTVCVDGAFPAKLQLSHWPDNSTPPELRADTSTGIAFNLIQHPECDKYLEGIQYISNNHYDTDGVLAAFVLMNPQFALQHREQLVSIAITGDFEEYTNDDALKSAIVIDSLGKEDPELLSFEIRMLPYPQFVEQAYLTAFEIIPGLISDVDEYESVWRSSFTHFQQSESSFEKQESVFSHYNDCNLSVIESPISLHRVSLFNKAKNERVLSITKSINGHLYQLQYKPFTWFETSRPKSAKRVGFESLVQILNQIETNKQGIWKIVGSDPILDWDYHLEFSDEGFALQPSSIPVYQVEDILLNFFS